MLDLLESLANLALQEHPADKVKLALVALLVVRDLPFPVSPD